MHEINELSKMLKITDILKIIRLICQVYTCPWKTVISSETLGNQDHADPSNVKLNHL